MDCDLAHRFCPRCGTSVYAALDGPEATIESFLPLLNSLYNLLAKVRGELPHPDRGKYISELSENVMTRRCRLEHDVLRKQSMSLIIKNIHADEDLMELYTLALSNSLAGYTYRSVEEMIFGKKAVRLSQPEREHLISSMRQEYGTELEKSEYRALHEGDPVDNRLLLCLALRWNNRHLKYLLAPDAIQGEWWSTVCFQNFKLSEDCVERVFRQMGLLSDNKSLRDSDKKNAQDNAEQDLLHGYVVRLSESLDPT
jgi:hypothetical protein